MPCVCHGLLLLSCRLLLILLLTAAFYEVNSSMRTHIYWHEDTYISLLSCCLLLSYSFLTASYCDVALCRCRLLGSNSMPYYLISHRFISFHVACTPVQPYCNVKWRLSRARALSLLPSSSNPAPLIGCTTSSSSSMPSTPASLAAEAYGDDTVV